MMWLHVVLAALIALSSFAVRLVPAGWPVLTVAGLNVLLVGGQAYTAHRSLKTARAARAERTVEFNNVLAPLASSLSRIPSRGPLRERQRGVAVFLADATNACVGLPGVKGVRATFFAVDEVDEARRFSPWDTKGRGDPPVSVFRRDDDGEGAEVWRLADVGEARFVYDTETEEIPFFNRNRERKYRTFITVPVTVGGDAVGLLTMNAPEPGDLTSEDVDTMRLVADLVATALGMVDGKCPPRAQ